MTGKRNMRQQKLKKAKNNGQWKLYGKKVTDNGVEKIVGGFENEPTSQAFDYISHRLAYLRLREEYLKKFGVDEREELAAIKKDHEILEKWLDQLNIRTDEGTLESRLNIVRAGLVVIQGSYFSASLENLSVVDNLRNLQATNRELYEIYKKFVLKIDERTGRFFVGINPNARDFLNQLTYIIADRFSQENVRQGKEIWSREGYHDSALPTIQQQKEGSLEGLTGLGVSELKPLLAVMFLDYYKTAANSGVLSPEEKKLVATTLAKLYYIEPLLAVKYLASIKHVAEICIDNPGAYFQGLTALSARIDTEVAPIYSTVTPFRVGLDLNIRRVINKLDMAFDDIMVISAGALARFTRYTLLDRNLELNLGRPPHEIVQKPPGYKYPLTLGLERKLGFGPPYPFPNYLITTPIVNPISRGAVVNAYPYGGGVQLPQLRLYTMPSGADAVKASMESYLWPSHPVLNIAEFLPGAYISPLSATQLVNEINRAFISRLAPGYEFSPIGGGGAMGLRGRSTEAQTLGEMFEDVEWGGGGLGSIITPTGGISAGGLADGRYLFAGMSAIGVPIGHIPFASAITAGKEGRKKEEIGIDSFAGGYERLDDESKRLLLDSVKTAWDPNNPSETIITVNRQENAEGKAWMTARYFYIDKEGTIYELKGGTNDFVEMLNYMAGYGDKNFNTPATYAWNIEPDIDRGGGALAIDIGKYAGMLHMQAVPFFTKQGEPQPMLLEWTHGDAYTEDIEPGKTRTYELVLPGKWLKLKPPAAEGEERKEREYVIQEGIFTWRTVEDVDAWETTVGVGLGTSPSGMIGRGGVFRKAMTPKTPWDLFGWQLKARGAGLYYEMGATNLEALALLQESEESREFVENIHRIGVTLYGQGELSNKMLMGALAHVVPQFTTQNGDFEFDRALWRFIGTLKALDAIGKLDIARIQGLDTMMNDYNGLMTNVRRNPAEAERLLNNFRAQNVENIRRVFDNYYLGVQINRDMSLEFNLLSREEGDWISNFKNPETIYGRFLWTFGNDFWRAFSSIPIHVTAPGLLPQQTIGIAGTGLGFDAFEGFWGQRIAFDVGILLVNKARGGAPPDWGKPGAFVQGAAQLFSNIADDYSGYKELERKYKEHSDAIKEANFSKIPNEILQLVCNSIHEDIISPSVLAKIRRGEQVILTPEQTGALLSALYSWFYDERLKIEKVFNGHMRSYIGFGTYVFNDNIFFDIGAFVEHVDKLKAYAILAKREEWSAFAGADYNITRNLILGTVAGVQFTGQEQAGGGVSIRYKFPAPFGELAGFSYIRSRDPPAYSPPAYAPHRFGGTPEFGFIVFYTIGEQTPLLQSVMQPGTAVPTRGTGY
ncbi:hypothetical protein J4450_02395 [Candidatus Micrarchaeota archaeon]|nr:hypothetical protein [Candidatus Micrarchaeota archaeon]